MPPPPPLPLLPTTTTATPTVANNTATIVTETATTKATAIATTNANATATATATANALTNTTTTFNFTATALKIKITHCNSRLILSGSALGRPKLRSVKIRRQRVGGETEMAAAVVAVAKYEGGNLHREGGLLWNLCSHGFLGIGVFLAGKRDVRSAITCFNFS
jgi:hypothetical protein